MSHVSPTQQLAQHSQDFWTAAAGVLTALLLGAVVGGGLRSRTRFLVFIGVAPGVVAALLALSPIPGPEGAAWLAFGVVWMSLLVAVAGLALRLLPARAIRDRGAFTPEE